ncbi:MAG TPA: pitrilysin family protein [Armatimonadota bacterium]
MAFSSPLSADNVRILPPLPNGLRLIVHEDHALPIVAMEVVVRSGSVHAAQPGLAHYVEHVVFQGTRRFPDPLGPQFALESAGGMSNAVTSRETTCFSGAIAAERADVLVRVLADVLLNPLLQDARCVQEQPVIAAEIAHDRDNPLCELLDNAYASSYRGDANQYAPKGALPDLALITPATIRAFHAAHYVPNNMSVILVGDITVARARALVAEAFGGAPSRPLVSVTPPVSPPSGPMLEIHVPRDLSDTYQVMVFPLPSCTAASPAFADVLTVMLVDGAEALLPARWTADGVRFGRFGIEAVKTRAPGRMCIWAETSPEMAAPLRRSTFALLAQLARTPAPEASLLQARQQLAIRAVLANETYSQQARALAYYEGIGDAGIATRYQSLLDAVTGEQVRRLVPTQCLAWITLGRPPKG